MGVETRRFLYVTRAGADGVETLRLGELLPMKGRGKRSARELAALATVAGPSGSEAVPESWIRLVPSPGNRHMVALADQSGLDFVDHNLRVVDMAAGAGVAAFNEHRFSTIGHPDWSSALFDAYLAAEAAMGVPPEDLAGYGWGVELEGAPGANIPYPELRWADDQTLVVGFRLTVVASTGVELGEEWFRFRLTEADGFAAFTPWTGAVPPAPPAGPLSLSAGGAILYEGVPLSFVRRGFPLPWFPILTKLRRATLVGGLVA
jgi:hypothetical protein